MGAKLTIVILFLTSIIPAQVKVDVNLNIKHSVGNISTFQRSKFINIHSAMHEKDWGGENFTDDLRQDFLENYNVYLGRDTGGISWYLNDIGEDPNRKGYADPGEITTKGTIAKNYYLECNWLHKYKDITNMIIAPQFYGFWTGRSQQPTKKGWKFANADAMGEFTGRFVNQFYGGLGPKAINYVEIINEPAYETLGGPYNYTNSINEIADFHVKASKAIKAHAPKVKVGGYTAAFPNLDAGGFKRWENRWKTFIDMAGDAMDFWSLHLYDFPSISNGKKKLRSGSNIEATFDMIDHYTWLSKQKINPYVISEFGAQTHDYMQEQWSSYRDWLHIKALNSQLMAFLERPNTIEKAIPFIMMKAEWGYRDNLPYQLRLLRRENEPNSYEGKWVYTDLIKFYDLWKHVEGTRIDTFSTDMDILVDAYVDGDKAFIILNNLDFEPKTIALNLKGLDDSISSINKRHLTLKDKQVTLEEEQLEQSPKTINLGAESTMIIEYTIVNPIKISETSTETKYFAESYYKPIVKGNTESFIIYNITKSNDGEAILRLGVGRSHEKSLTPVVKVNGESITVPKNYRGYDQADRISFFGVLEIPVPYNILNDGKNDVSITFPDAGGHISSVCLQVFNFSKSITRSKP
ncbi:hypothetical protein MHTCC0001_08040 [Flavobacteriaceae bacterium MHTCC 0001]